MHGDEHPAKRSLRDARERAIQGLSTAFGRDELSLEEFERRVDAAFATAAVEELASLLSDLSPESKQAGVVASAVGRDNESALVPIVSDKNLAANGSLQHVPQGTVHARVPSAVAIFGNVERRGRLIMAPKSRILAVFGNVEMDLRDAVLPLGGVEIEVRVLFGNVELTIPPDWSVSCEGMGVFGSFSSMHRVPPGEVDGQPLVRITGTATFGNFEIHTLPPGINRTLPRLLGSGR